MRNTRKPCNCLVCQSAGVTDLPVVLVPGDETNPKPHELHGEPLRAWYEARDRFMRAARAAVGAPGRHAAGFEELVRTA